MAKLPDKIRLRKVFLQAVAIIVTMFAIQSCVKDKDSSGKPVLAVSYESQRWLLEQIVGNDFDIVTLLPSGRDTETYDPDMATMSGLSKAEIYFNTATMGFETAIGKKVAENFPGVKSIDVSEGITPITGTHGESSGIVSKKKEGAFEDPHLLTSIANARTVAANMLSALKTLSPDSAAKYTANFNRLDSLLQSASVRMDSIMIAGNLKGRSFIVIHPFLTYFAEERGMTQLSLERDGKEATPRQLKERIDEARAESPVVLFYEPGSNDKYAEEVASSLGIKGYPLNVNGEDFVEKLIYATETMARQ